MTRTISAFLFLLFYLASLATTQGQENLDSLVIKSEAITNDSMVIEMLLKKTSQYQYSNRNFADSILNIATKRASTISLLASVNNTKSQLLMLGGDYENALQLLNKTKFDLAAYYSDTHPQYLILLNIRGLTYYYQAAYDKALIDFFERLKISESLNNKQLQIRTLNNIGISYERLQDDTKALSYYNQALSIAQNTSFENLNLKNDQQRKYFIAGLASNIGVIYINNRKLDSAITTSLVAYNVSKEIQNVALSCDAAINLGRAYTGTKQYNKANKYFTEGIALATEMKDPARTISASIAFGGSLVYNNKIKEGIQHLMMAFKLTNENGIKEQQIPLHEELIKAYQKDNNFKKAFLYSTALDTIKRDSYANSKIKITEELDKKYQSAIKEVQLNKSIAKLKEEKSIRYLLISLSGLLLFFALSIWSLFKNRRLKTQQQIALQKEKIRILEHEQRLNALDYIVQGQEEERKRIAQDLHDGLGGLLTSVRRKVSTLQMALDDLSNTSIVKETEALIENACDEVRRISHDMMPATLVSLGLQDAIEDLVVDVIPKNKIQFNLKYSIDDSSISDNIKVNVYRIIQEIVNNTVKHANATIINCTLSKESNSLHLIINDDGKGFNIKNANSNDGIGLKTIHSRVAYLGGTQLFTSNKEEGTSYDIMIPLSTPLS